MRRARSRRACSDIPEAIEVEVPGMLRDYDPITAQLIAFVPRVVGAALTLLVGVVLLRLALPAAREGLKRAGIAQAAPFVMTAVTAAGWIVILSAAFQALGLSGLALGLFGGGV